MVRIRLLLRCVNMLYVHAIKSCNSFVFGVQSVFGTHPAHNDGGETSQHAVLTRNLYLTEIAPLAYRRELNDAGFLSSSEAWLSRGLAHAGAGDVPAGLQAVQQALDISTTPQVVNACNLSLSRW